MKRKLLAWAVSNYEENYTNKSCIEWARMYFYGYEFNRGGDHSTTGMRTALVVWLELALFQLPER